MPPKGTPTREDLLKELEEAYREMARLLEVRDAAVQAQAAASSPALADSMDTHTERLMAMGELAAEIGHEINNYLSVLGGRAELIERALLRGDNERAVKFARVVVEQVEKMRRLTRSLMDFSRQGTEKKMEDPAELVVDAVQLLGIHARNAGVKLTAGLPGDLPRVQVDRAQIEQALVNLIKNAIEATSGRPQGRVLVGAAFDPARAELRFEVQDNGPGIPASLCTRLFEPHVTGKEGGRGFGLAVAYKVARNHAGRLEFETVEERGTRFMLALPAAGMEVAAPERAFA